MRVLFVEDEERDYRLYIEAVGVAAKTRGCAVDLVQSLEDALRCVQAESYDVIVLDLNIPLGANCPVGYVDCEFNGKYLVGHLRDQGATPRIVCLTNYALEAGGAIGVWADLVVLPKSCTRAALTHAVFP